MADYCKFLGDNSKGSSKGLHFYDLILFVWVFGGVWGLLCGDVGGIGRRFGAMLDVFALGFF